MSDLFELCEPIDKVDADLLLARFETIYKTDGEIDFLIDRTVDIDLFSEVIDDFDPLVAVEKFFIAQPISSKQAKQPIALLRLRNDKKFNEYAPQLIELLLEQKGYDSTRQIICGWGNSTESLDIIKTSFMKNSVAQLENSKKSYFLRWYDPRVQYVFQNLAPEVLYLHHLKAYKSWEYLHPTGLYRKTFFETAFKFNNVYPKSVIDFLMMCEDVNSINKYLINKDIPSNQIEPMRTYEHLILIRGNSANIEFGVISELVYWFYMISPNLIEHEEIKALWHKEDYEQILEKLNTYSDLEIEVLKRDVVNG